MHCEIIGIKGDHILDENSMSNILSLSHVADSFGVTIDTSIDDAFCAHASIGITHHRHTKYHMHAVNGCVGKNVTSSEWKSVFGKEGTKGKKACLINLAVDFFYLSPRKCERVKVARKSSQKLDTHAASVFKVVIRENLTRDDQETTEYSALTKKSFESHIGGHKGMTKRSNSSPMQSQTIENPQELLSLDEEV